MEKKISFTDSQYKTLVKLVFLGEWVMNANKTKDYDKETAELSEYIYSKKENFALKHWFRELEFGGEEIVEKKILEFLKDVEIYNEETFLVKLIDKLAERDIERGEGKAILEANPMFDELDAFYKLQGKYEDEIDKNGLANLEMKVGK